MRGAYLRSDVFYSFSFKPSSRQHPVFEMYVCGVLFVCSFIDFACELILECISKSEGIFVYNTIHQISWPLHRYQRTSMSQFYSKLFLDKTIIRSLIFFGQEKQL